MSLAVDFSATSEFKPDPVLKASKRIWTRFLFKAGAYVRRTARSTLQRRAMQKLSEMTEEQRSIYRQKQREFKEGKRDKKPRKPDKVSAPGEAPRLHSKNSPLKKKLNFSVDKAAAVMVSGPERSNDGIAGNLEFGRGPIKQARPFMQPAYRKALPRLPALLRASA